MSLFVYFGKDLPSYEHLAKYDPPVMTRLHAGDGRLFGEYATEKRVFVPIRTIPPHILKTFCVVEDKNFYDHFGIDITGLIRATIHNAFVYFTKRGSVIGGSTITQQVAKNFLLSGERTLSRKIKEAILALRLERTYSKDKILELYLNEIYLGGAYGVAAAALHYFNKSLDELTVAEAAFLAALPKAPSNYHPVRHPKAALQRRNWVISRMLEEGIITVEEAREAKQQPITLYKRQDLETINAKFFAEEVRRYLHQTYGEKILYQGGLSVRTTIDTRLQNEAKKALRNGLIAYDRRHGWHGTLKNIDVNNWQEILSNLAPPPADDPWALAVVLSLSPTTVTLGLKNGEKGEVSFESMKWARKSLRNAKGMPYLGPVLKEPSDILKQGDVVLVQPIPKEKGKYTLEQIPGVDGALVAMDPHTGRVLALVGGYSYERTQFNRATQALRQTGSAFKPFVYLAALENGYTPASRLLDAPFVLENADGSVWTPKNIEKRFFGTNTLRKALEKSHNLTLVRLANDIGMDKIADVAKRFNIYDDLPPYLATVLGSQETTLLRFTGAYAMLVNGGKKITPILIDRIQDRHGKTIYKSDTRVCFECTTQPFQHQFPPEIPDTRQQVTDPQTAYQIVSILEGAVARGTARRTQIPGQTIAAKTGTSNDYMDVWTLGFSRDLVVGVFIGFDKPKSLGRFETGGRVTAVVFKDFMQAALKGKQGMSFRVPDGIKFININRLTGERAKTGDQDTILEAFKWDQEPNYNESSIEKDMTTKESLPINPISGIY